MKKIRKNAFTLAETLVTVVILGIVAAIVVPNLINRQVENANRTRVKKAIASYEKAINYIIIENYIRTTEGIREFGQDDNCTSAKKYFKTVQNGTNDCIFRTADRVWWDITDLTNPLISLNDEITTVDTLYNGNAISCIYDRNSNPKRTCNGYASVATAGEYWISDNLGTISSAEAQDRTGSVCTTENCVNNGDYYEAAKRKCAQSGGHLATLAELSIARSKGMMPSSSWFWASEEDRASYSYYVVSNGTVFFTHKFNTDGQVICVGD